MAYTRKTRDEYEILGFYGYGWEVVTTEETRKEARDRLKEYYQNDGKHPYKIKKRRVKLT